MVAKSVVSLQKNDKLRFRVRLAGLMGLGLGFRLKVRIRVNVRVRLIVV